MGPRSMAHQALVLMIVPTEPEVAFCSTSPGLLPSLSPSLSISAAGVCCGLIGALRGTVTLVELPIADAITSTSKKQWIEQILSAKF